MLLYTIQRVEKRTNVSFAFLCILKRLVPSFVAFLLDEAFSWLLLFHILWIRFVCPPPSYPTPFARHITTAFRYPFAGYHDIKMIFIQSKSLRIGWNVLLYHFHYKELPSICLVSGSNIFHRSINALWKYRIGWIVPDKLFTFLPIGRFNYIDNNMNQIFNDRIETSKWYS